MVQPTQSSRDAEVAVIVYTRRSVRSSAHAHAVLSALQSLPPQLRLVRFAIDETSDPLELHRDSSAFEATWCGDGGSTQASRFLLIQSDGRSGPRALVAFASPRPASYSSLTLTIPARSVALVKDRLLDVAAQLFNAFDGEFGAVRSRGEFLDQHGDSQGGVSVVGVEFGALLPGVYFATLFDQRLVSSFPSGWSEGLPPTAIHSLGEGGVLVQTAPNPLDWRSSAATAARSVVREGIGATRFFSRGAAGAGR